MGADINFQKKPEIKKSLIPFSCRRKNIRLRTYTPLSLAILCSYRNQSYKVNLIEILLKNGAEWKLSNPPKKQSQYCFNLYEVVEKIKNFRVQQQKLRFISVLLKYGIEEMQQKGCRTHLLLAILDAYGIKDKYEIISNNISLFWPKQNIFSTTHNITLSQNSIYDHEGLIYKQFQPFTKVLLDLIKDQCQNKTKQQKNKQIQLIKNIINLGINPNCSRSRYKYTSNQKYNFIYQTALHRCIMNNQIQLVEYLIEKGADVHQMCKLKIFKPVFPHQWTQKQKQDRKKQYQNTLKILERKKIGYIIRDQKDKLEDLQKQMQQARSYFLENQAPKYCICQKQLNCLELCQQFKVDNKIYDLFRISISKKEKN